MLKKILALFLMLYAAVAMAAVDANKATPAELDGVKGIGPALSGKIVDERKKAPFKDWDDLVNRVKGIGDKNAAKLSENGLTVNGASFKGTTTAAPAKDEKKDAKATAKEEKKEAKAEAKAEKKDAEAKKDAAMAKADAKTDKATSKKEKKEAKAEAKLEKKEAEAKKDAAVAKAEAKKEKAEAKADAKKDAASAKK